MVDLATDKTNLKLAGEVYPCDVRLRELADYRIQFYDSGKVVSSVCHGPAYVFY